MKKLISNTAYHANEAVGSTTLKKIASKTLMHAMTEEFKESPALAIGSAAHAAILEPETFKNDFAVSQKFDRRTKQGKADALAFTEANAGKIIIDQLQAEIVEGIRKSVLSHPIASSMLSGGEAEYSYFASIMDTECKCRPDYYLPEQGCLVDLKTCQDASRDGFTRACINFGYAIQAAFYLDVFNKANGTDIKEFYFVAVETSKPFAVNTFRMGEVELKLGREQYLEALKKLKQYNSDPSKLSSFGYKEQINNIEFPIWALERMEA
jgi:exodeoxyribonuclease VIII